MKALKRISAIVISLAMLLSCALSTVVFAAEFNDVTADNAYYKAIIDLVDKGIINGYDNGDGTFSFKPDGNITRAEFAKMIAVADAPNGYAFANATSSFTDVAGSADWAIGYIEYAVSRKIINGMGDGTFAPNEPVTYEQAIKMIVCALNYGFAAEGTNPWYQGYINVANQLNLTKNAMSATGTPAARGLIAQLIYNMNSTAPAVQTGTDSTGNPIYSAGNTSKEEDSKGTKTMEGQLLAVFNETITGESEGLNKKEALVMVKDEEEIFLIGDYTVEDIAAFLGYEVKVTYSEDNSGEYVIEKISKTSSNEDYIITDMDIDTITEDALEYFDEDARNGISELKFASDMKVLKNGGAIDMDNLVAELSIDSGEIKFIDYDGNNRMDVAFITSYETMYVGSVANSNGVYNVYDKFNTTRKFTFDDDNDDITVKVMANGSDKLTDGTLSSIAASNIISVAVAADNAEEIEIIVSKKTASGSSSTSEVKSVTSGDYPVIKLGNTSYDVSNYYMDNIDNATYPQSLSVGDTCVVYLDFTGKIAAVDKKSASTSYGYITKVGPASSGMDADEYLVSMYDATGRYYDRLPVASKGFKINGASADAEDLEAAIVTAAGIVNDVKDESKIVNAEEAILVKYELSNGTLKSVYLVGEDDGIIPKYISEDTQALTYSSSSNSFRLNGSSQFTISASTKIFVVPENRNDNDEYRVTTGTGYFTDGVPYVVDAFDADGTAPAKAVIVYGVTAIINGGAESFLVKSVDPVADPDAENEDSIETVMQLTYYSLNGGDPKTIIAKKDDVFDGVDAGDIVRILTVGGKAEKIQHIYDADAEELLTEDIIADGGSYDDEKGWVIQGTGGTTYYAMHGTITRKPANDEDTTFEISFDGDPENAEGFTISNSTSIIRYTGDTSDRGDLFEFGISKNELLDINDEDLTDPENPVLPSNVVVIRYNSSGAVKAIIIY